MAERSGRPSPITVLVLLGCCAVLQPVTMDMYLPAMPSIASELGTSVGEIQFTLAAFSLGVAAGHLLYGPFADRYGRRPVLLVAMVGYTLVSLASSAASDPATLSVLRFFHGMAGGATGVLSRAIVRDLYDGPEAARFLSFFSFFAGLGAIVGPVIGGHVTTAWGGMATFFVLDVLGVAITLVFFARLVETYPAERRLTPAGEAPARITALARSADFVSYSLVGSATYCGLFAILAGLSPVLIGALGVSPTVFGYLFAAVMLSNVIAAPVAGGLVRRLGLQRMILTGAALSAAAGIGLWIATEAGWVNVPLIVAAAFVFMVGFTVITPSAAAGALSPFPRMAGRASAVMGLLNLGGGAAVAVVLGLVHDGTHRPLVIALAAAGGASLALALTIFWRSCRRAISDAV